MLWNARTRWAATLMTIPLGSLTKKRRTPMARR
jgi:hypothetical protein